MKKYFPKAVSLAAALLLLVLLMPSIVFAQSQGQTPGDRFGLNEAVQGTGVIEGKDPLNNWIKTLSIVYNIIT